MEEGYARRRTHRQQIRFERRLFWIFTVIGLSIAGGVAVMALLK